MPGFWKSSGWVSDFKSELQGESSRRAVWLKLHFAENATELFRRMEKLSGWICSSWIEEEQLHVDVVPSQLRLPRRYAFRYVMIEVLDISSKFDLVVEDAFCTAVLLRKTRSFPHLRRRIISWQKWIRSHAEPFTIVCSRCLRTVRRETADCGWRSSYPGTDQL